ncbi:phospholipase A2 inhibitor gamma subunit B-like [Hemicordylus capensis]|uniref:phospholipase A2 inhibitor gamma subunit B-like n=1 Tax=Hemicordylus capensis TaxID=884348 RepID=UPI002304B962|nr:phospholipase A2 inhibitor gamma subunit B-like [Hemicordylus capensis]
MKLLLLSLFALLPLVAGTASTTHDGVAHSDEPATKAKETEKHTVPTHSHSTTPLATTLECECTDCKGNTCTVKGGGGCFAVAVASNLGGSEVSGTFKGCWDKFDTCKDGVTVMTPGNGTYWRSNMSCCKEDKCNHNIVIKAPEEDTTLSHQSCHSCFAVNATTCNATITKCFQPEDSCFNVTGYSITGGKNTSFVGKGCATSEIAVIKSGPTLKIDEDTYHFSSIKKVPGSATRAPGSLFLAIFLPGLLLLLNKSLY